MDTILAIIFTMVFIGLVFYALTRLKRVSYLIGRENVIELLEMVLAHKATVNDWQVFLGVPIRHNPFLEEIRQKCEWIEYEHGQAFRDRLLTKEGEEHLVEVLELLRSKDDVAF